MKIPKFIVFAFVLFLFTTLWANMEAQVVEEPDKIFKNNKCNSCHSIKLIGFEKKNKKSKAPDLSNVGLKHEIPFLMDYLLKKVEIDGKKHGITFKGTEKELVGLVGWLATFRGEPGESQTPEGNE